MTDGPPPLPLACVQDALYALDAEGRITRWEASAQALFAVAAADALGRPVWQVLRGQAESEVRALLREAVATGDAFFETTRGAVRTRGHIVAEAAGGGVAIGVSERDLSPLKHLESQLFEQLWASEAAHALLGRVLDAVPDVAIVGCGPDGRIEVWSAGAARLLGLPPAEAAGKRWADLLGGLLAPGAPPEAASAAWRGEVELAVGARRFPAQLVSQRVQTARLADAGSVTAILDLTERRRLEEARLDAMRREREAAENAARMKSEFVANMSHEIRTPLNAIIGLASLLADAGLPSQEREYAHTIRVSGDHLLTVINDILDFSKIESGRMELEEEPLHVRTLVEETLDLVALRAATRNLELAYEMDDTVPEAVMGDAPRIRQVLLNLLSNAVKFTERGEVILSVRASPGAHASHACLEFRVRDTGPGISPEKLTRLFQPFSQGDASTTRRYGGTGLGLVISKRLAARMDGDITVESEVGRGSTFRFLTERPVATTLNAIPPRRDGLGGLRALVVDDVPINRTIVGAFLRRWGMTWKEAGDADGALEQVRKNGRFDVVLTDLQMPGVDGLGLARQLGEALPGVPVVILSSDITVRNSSLSLPRNIRGVLHKPVKEETLYQGIAAAVGRSAGAVASVAAVSVMDAGLGARHPLRILLVEDNVTNQRVAVAMLRRLGYTAKVAGHGEEALRMLEAEAFDLVFMDVQMPVLDGLEATRAIRRRGGPQPRIVAMTANALSEDRARCLAAGMEDYLPKPVTVPALQAALQRAAQALGKRPG